MRHGLLLACLLLGAPTICSSNMTCIGFDAELAEVEDPHGLLQGLIRPGMILTGQYVFEAATADGNDLPGLGQYWHHRDPYGIRATVGPYTFETDPEDVEFLIEIGNDHSSASLDRYSLSSRRNLPLPHGPVVEEIGWGLESGGADLLDSDALFEAPPRLEDWLSLPGLTIAGHDPEDHDKRFFLRGHVFAAKRASCPPYPVCIQLRAEIHLVDDPHGTLEGRIAVGDSLYGAYRYDGATIDGNDLPTVGDYLQRDPPSGITLIAGGWFFRSNPGKPYFLVEIVNDHRTDDHYLLRSYENLTLPNGAPLDEIHWQLDDDSATALDSERLPLDPPDLDDWTSWSGLNFCSNDFYGQRDYFVRARVYEVEPCGQAGLEPLPSPDRIRARVALSATPNPFRASTRIQCPIAGATTHVDIFDPSGRRVRTLRGGPGETGESHIIWDGRNDAGRRVESGIYFVRVAQAGRHATGRLLLMRE